MPKTKGVSYDLNRAFVDAGGNHYATTSANKLAWWIRTGDLIDLGPNKLHDSFPHIMAIGFVGYADPETADGPFGAQSPHHRPEGLSRFSMCRRPGRLWHPGGLYKNSTHRRGPVANDLR